MLVSNRRQSYNVNIELAVEELPGTYASNTLDLKNPYFRYTGAPIQPPPGCNTTSPSEDYWATLDTTNTAGNAAGLCNGLQAASAATVVQNGTGAAASLLLNGATVVPNGLPVAAMNSGPMGMTTPVNLTAAAAAAAAAASGSSPFADVLGGGGLLGPQTGAAQGLYAVQGGGNVVNNINNMNFPVNQSLMIGDYAAAVGGQTIPPFKPL